MGASCACHKALVALSSACSNGDTFVRHALGRWRGWTHRKFLHLDMLLVAGVYSFDLASVPKVCLFTLPEDDPTEDMAIDGCGVFCYVPDSVCLSCQGASCV